MDGLRDELPTRGDPDDRPQSRGFLKYLFLLVDVDEEGFVIGDALEAPKKRGAATSSRANIKISPTHCQDAGFRAVDIAGTVCRVSPDEWPTVATVAPPLWADHGNREYNA